MFKTIYVVKYSLVLALFFFSACRQTLSPGIESLPAQSLPTETQPGFSEAKQTLIPTITPEIVKATPTPSIETVASLPPPTVEPAELPTSVSVLPDPEAYTWLTVAEGLERPVGLAHAGDGSNRLFVLEQQGLVRILKDSKIQPEPFLDLRDRVSTTGGTTRGLLGLAFHPNYALNGMLFIHYTRAGGEIVVSRLLVSENSDRADPDSEKILLTVQPPVGEHNGGGLAFGPDGFLYVALGDGGGPGYQDQAGNAQNTQTLLGGLLRLDVDTGELYGIPADNPFAQGGGRPEIWAYGLRNPWQFAFDHLTGDLYLADVGESQWEELNYLPAGSPGGANFGWNYREGSHSFLGLAPSTLALQDPILEYDHTQGCSITGGEVYRGQALPEWYGVYLYGDYCSGTIWGLLHDRTGNWQNEKMFSIQAFMTSFAQDEKGELYLVDYRGNIFQLIRK